MEERMYYTYIVASRSHNLYVGMTGEIENRVRQHKEGRFDGYSKRYNCNRLVWFERHPYVNDAIARERQLKGWSREDDNFLNMPCGNFVFSSLSAEMVLESGFGLVRRAKRPAHRGEGPWSMSGIRR